MNLEEQVKVLTSELEASKAGNETLKAENESLKAGKVEAVKSDLPSFKVKDTSYTLKYANVDIDGKTYSAAEIKADKTLQELIVSKYSGCVTAQAKK